MAAMLFFIQLHKKKESIDGLIRYMYLEAAGKWSTVDLDVGGVGTWKKLSIPQPGHSCSRIGEDFTGNVNRISLPGINNHWTFYFGSIYKSKVSR